MVKKKVTRSKSASRKAKISRHKPVRKVAARQKTKKTAPKFPKKKTLIGKVSHYYTDLGVCVIDLKGDLKRGDKISIEGMTTSFSQKVQSIQIDHLPVGEARAGDAVGVKVAGRTREGDNVFRI